MAYEDQLLREAQEYRARKARRKGEREENHRRLMRPTGQAYDPRQQGIFEDQTLEEFSVVRP